MATQQPPSNPAQNCIKKSCLGQKDKDGKKIPPTWLYTMIMSAHGQFRDAEHYHCGGCGEKWTQLAGVRTKTEYKLWKEAQDAAMKKVMDKVNQEKVSQKAAEAAAPSLTHKEI